MYIGLLFLPFGEKFLQQQTKGLQNLLVASCGGNPSLYQTGVNGEDGTTSPAVSFTFWPKFRQIQAENDKVMIILAGNW